jgi:hypothetical protein
MLKAQRRAALAYGDCRSVSATERTLQTIHWFTNLGISVPHGPRTGAIGPGSRYGESVPVRRSSVSGVHAGRQRIVSKPILGGTHHRYKTKAA